MVGFRRTVFLAFGAGAGAGETCDACEELISKTQFVTERISTTGGKGIQFHVGCFHLWDEERCAPGRT
jgi:hypothetical protein